MNTSVKHKPAWATSIRFSNQKLFVFLDDRREIGVPTEWFPKLRNAREEELSDWRFIGNGIGIHWETLAEDLSVEGLLN